MKDLFNHCTKCCMKEECECEDCVLGENDCGCSQDYIEFKTRVENK